MVVYRDNDDLLVGEISSMDVIDKDNYISYSELTFSYETDKLFNIFNDSYDLNSNSVGSIKEKSNSNYYHLI